MDRRITIWRNELDHTWRIAFENSPVMGDAVWAYSTWRECMMHADVLRRVWNHI